MEITTKVPSFRTCQKDLSQDLRDIKLMKESPNSNLNSKCAFSFKNQSYDKKDALFAVKLDPAVLEAQVTVAVGATRIAKNDVDQITRSVDSPPMDTGNSSALTSSSTQLSAEFKTMLSTQRAALQSLSSQQFDLLLRYVDTLRKQRLSVQKQMECAFCKNNGHPMSWYSTHSLKDSKGRVRCPILRSFYCRRCGATGDNAHTIKHCPGNMW